MVADADSETVIVANQYGINSGQKMLNANLNTVVGL